MFELYAMDGGGRVCLVFPPKPDPPPMDGAGKDIDTNYYKQEPYLCSGKGNEVLEQPSPAVYIANQSYTSHVR